jgi:hypothetical protein
LFTTRIAILVAGRSRIRNGFGTQRRFLENKCLAYISTEAVTCEVIKTVHNAFPIVPWSSFFALCAAGFTFIFSLLVPNGFPLFGLLAIRFRHRLISFPPGEVERLVWGGLCNDVLNGNGRRSTEGLGDGGRGGTGTDGDGL